MNPSNINYYSKEYIEQARVFVNVLPPMPSPNKGFRDRLVETTKEQLKTYDIVSCFKSLLPDVGSKCIKRKLGGGTQRTLGKLILLIKDTCPGEEPMLPGCPLLSWVWNVVQTCIIEDIQTMTGVTLHNWWADNFLLSGRRVDAVCRMLERNYHLQLVPSKDFCGFTYEWCIVGGGRNHVGLDPRVIKKLMESGDPDKFAPWYIDPFYAAEVIPPTQIFLAFDEAYYSEAYKTRKEKEANERASAAEQSTTSKTSEAGV